MASCRRRREPRRDRRLLVRHMPQKSGKMRRYLQEVEDLFVPPPDLVSSVNVYLCNGWYEVLRNIAIPAVFNISKCLGKYNHRAGLWAMG